MLTAAEDPNYPPKQTIVTGYEKHVLARLDYPYKSMDTIDAINHALQNLYVRAYSAGVKDYRMQNIRDPYIVATIHCITVYFTCDLAGEIVDTGIN